MYLPYGTHWSSGLQSVRTRISKGNKMTKRRNPYKKRLDFFPICYPDDSFVIYHFDFDRLPFQSQPVQGSRFVGMSEKAGG